MTVNEEICFVAELANAVIGSTSWLPLRRD